MLVRLIGDFKLVVRMRMREVVGVSLSISVVAVLIWINVLVSLRHLVYYSDILPFSLPCYFTMPSFLLVYSLIFVLIHSFSPVQSLLL